MEGLKLFGKNWKKVEEHIGTRTGAQIRSHAQKYFNRLEKEMGPSNSRKHSGHEDQNDDSSYETMEWEKENILSSSNTLNLRDKGEFSKNVSVGCGMEKQTIYEALPTLSNLNSAIFPFSESNLCEVSPKEPTQETSIENSPILNFKDSILFPKPASSYFNFILSQIAIECLRVPKLYDLCGWGADHRDTKTAGPADTGR